MQSGLQSHYVLVRGLLWETVINPNECCQQHKDLQYKEQAFRIKEYVVTGFKCQPHYERKCAIYIEERIERKSRCGGQSGRWCLRCQTAEDQSLCPFTDLQLMFPRNHFPLSISLTIPQFSWTNIVKCNKEQWYNLCILHICVHVCSKAAINDSMRMKIWSFDMWYAIVLISHINSVNRKKELCIKLITTLWRLLCLLLPVWWDLCY